MTPPPDHHDWPTKAEVAKAFGISMRSLEYLIEGGKIEVARRSVPGRRPLVVCNPLDVARVASERRGAAHNPGNLPAMPLSLEAAQELLQAAARVQSLVRLSSEGARARNGIKP